jgi:hypothetical protein
MSPSTSVSPAASTADVIEGAVDIEMLQRMLLIQSEEAAFHNASKDGDDKIREFDDQVRSCLLLSLLSLLCCW